MQLPCRRAKPVNAPERTAEPRIPLRVGGRNQGEDAKLCSFSGYRRSEVSVSPSALD